VSDAWNTKMPPGDFIPPDQKQQSACANEKQKKTINQGGKAKHNNN